MNTALALTDTPRTPNDCLASGAETPCGDCNAWGDHAYNEAIRGEEPFALLGAMLAVNDAGPAVITYACAACQDTGEIQGRYSRHNPTGLEPCPNRKCRA